MSTEPVEQRIVYYKFEDGAYGTATTADAAAVITLPADSVAISKEEYLADVPPLTDITPPEEN